MIPTGGMRNTLLNGQLAGLIALDSIAQPGMYGIGPLEYLRGELLWDGKVFVSEQEKHLGMQVVQRTKGRGPFFVHQRVEQWTAVLPDSVVDLPTLDAFPPPFAGSSAVRPACSCAPARHGLHGNTRAPGRPSSLPLRSCSRPMARASGPRRAERGPRAGLLLFNALFV